MRQVEASGSDQPPESNQQQLIAKFNILSSLSGKDHHDVHPNLLIYNNSMEGREVE